MSSAPNLLKLVFSLAVGIASLLGALFIIDSLLAVPQNDFEDDNHEMTQPIFFPQMGKYTLQHCYCMIQYNSDSKEIT